MKTNKIKIFFNQNENKGKLSFKSKSWNKKNKNKNTTRVNKNPIGFYCKKLKKQSYDNKTYLKLMLNKLKVMRNSTSTYIPWAPCLRKYFNKLPIYMWPIFTRVHPCVNYEWTKTQLKVNKNSTKSELKFN
jgi:hypothetical protein